MCSDEIYCQLIKQLTANPSQDSVSKGWWLMAICLETFPPPPEFENYLEIFLRNKAPDPQTSERLVKMLHATVYGGQRQQPPSESEMQQLLAGGSLRGRAFEQKEEYRVPAPALPPRAQIQPIMGVVPIIAGGQGMAGYNPHANAYATTAQPQQPVQPQRPARPGQPQRPGAPAAFMPPPPEPEPLPPPPVERGPCPWAVAYHPETNQAYYYHSVTNETTWDRPPPEEYWEE